MLRRAALRYIKAWGHAEYNVMGIVLPQPEEKTPASEWMLFVKWKLIFSVCSQAKYDALLPFSHKGGKTCRTHLSFLSTN